MSKKTNPKFMYVSQCCNAQATKEPCERTKEEKASNEFGEHSLGTWSCNTCGKTAKVNRHLNVDNTDKKE